MNPDILEKMERVTGSMRSVCRISDDTIRQLAECLAPCSFRKRDKLIRENIFNRYAYFIESGMTRSYWLVDGEEITTSFSVSGSIVFSMDELYYGRISEEYVEALTEIKAFRIRTDVLLSLFDTNIELANWGRIIHQNEYRRLHRSHKERLTMSAQDRYEAFMCQFPEVCRSVNLKYIASYLGITAPTLSRLRGKLT